MADRIKNNVEKIKQIFKRREAKFIGGFTLIIFAGLALWQAALYFSPEARERREAIEYFENLNEAYRTDTYGGETPEETLELFTQALEAGDIELASKYFLPDEREEWEANLWAVKRNNHLKAMIDDLRSSIKSKEEKGQATFVGSDANNEVTFILSLAKNPETKVWKITDL